MYFWCIRSLSLISPLQKKYRQLPDSLKFTSVTDSPDMVHAKTSYQQCNEAGENPKVTQRLQTLSCVFMGFTCIYNPPQRLYKSGKNEDMHKYTLHPDDPDFVRAKINAQQISDVSIAIPFLSNINSQSEALI